MRILSTVRLRFPGEGSCALFDLETLNEFGQWAETEQLQIIATRVSTGDECSIIITDGYSEEVPQAAVETPKYQF